MLSEVDTASEGQHRTRLDEVEMSLEALSNVIRNNNGEPKGCVQRLLTPVTPPPPLPHPMIRL